MASRLGVLSGFDYAVGFVVFLLLLAGLVAYSNNRHKGEVYKVYFLPAFILRAGGAFLTAAMYVYYYGYGDTLYYYYAITGIHDAFSADIGLGLEMVFADYESYSFEARQYVYMGRFMIDSSSAVVVRLGGFFSFFVGGSFMGISILMTFTAFFGCWRLFKVFYDLFPAFHRELAFACLFVPSVFFWGTGVMKDSILMGGIGVFVHAAYYLFIKREKIFSSLIWFVISLQLLLSIKVYVILALAPAMVVWVFMTYQSRISNPGLRRLAGPLFIGVSILGGFLVLQQLSAVFQKFALEKILEEAEKTQWWLTLNTKEQGGTGFSLGEIEYTPLGLVKVFPKAVNVTLFRPYPWEATKIINLPAMAESMACLFITLYIFFRTGIIRTLRIIYSEPVVLFCLIFSVVFAFAVGFSTTNFGALARYKIPCLPFYFVALAILYRKTLAYREAKRQQRTEGQKPAALAGQPA